MGNDIASAQAQEKKANLYFIVGLTLGLAIGVLLTMVLVARSRSTADQPQVMAAAPTPTAPPRWFIWLGSAPAVGQAFSSAAECETGRKQFLAAEAADIQAQAQAMSKMSVREAVMLGQTPQTLIDRRDQLRGAYCRAAD